MRGPRPGDLTATDQVAGSLEAGVSWLRGPEQASPIPVGKGLLGVVPTQLSPQRKAAKRQSLALRDRQLRARGSDDVETIESLTSTLDSMFHDTSNAVAVDSWRGATAAADTSRAWPLPAAQAPNARRRQMRLNVSSVDDLAPESNKSPLQAQVADLAKELEHEKQQWRRAVKDSGEAIRGDMARMLREVQNDATLSKQPELALMPVGDAGWEAEMRAARKANAHEFDAIRQEMAALNQDGSGRRELTASSPRGGTVRRLETLVEDLVGRVKELEGASGDEWEEHTAPTTGRPYFFNPKTQQSTWVDPRSAKSNPRRAPPTEAGSIREPGGADMLDCE